MVNLTVNGRAVALDIPSDTSLLWAIRDELDLKGTKFGCGIGMCGACTVHVNGVAQRSCITPVSSVADASVTTIEGLTRMAIILCSKLGLQLKPPSADTASRVKLCRLRAC